ncbi:MAG TPA: acyltransferase [Prosthecobacter sp.]
MHLCGIFSACHLLRSPKHDLAWICIPSLPNAPLISQDLHPQEKPSDSRQRIQSLDSLRFLAACAVFFSHAQPVSGEGWMDDLAHFSLVNAKSAVAFFFVLSGLVLHLSLRRTPLTPGSYGRFLVRRCFRIYPVYYVSLLLGFLVLQLNLSGIAVLNFDETALQVLSHPPVSSEQWAHHLLLVSPGLDIDAVNPPIWTLAAEMRVAFILPFISWLFARLSLRSGLVFLAAAFGLAPWIGQHSIASFSIVPLFMLGVWAGEHRATFLSMKASTSWLVLAAGAALYLLAPSMRHWVDGRGLSHFNIAALGSVLIILAIEQIAPLKKALLALVPPKLSDLSYSIYTLNFPLVLGLSYLFWKGMLPFDWFVPVSFVVLITLSLFTYRCVEAPMIRLGRRLTRKTQTSPCDVTSDATRACP